jgi:hypothetical protein
MLNIVTIYSDCDYEKYNLNFKYKINFAVFVTV